jgi:molybdate transport system substrate-binding protein
VRHRLVVLVTVLAVTAVACGGDGDAGDATTSPGEAMLVLAAASLTDAFTDIAAGFEAANEGVDVDLSFGASSALATQIVEGAPAAVFASASGSQMDAVVEEGQTMGEPVVFATNLLEIAVHPESEGEVTSIEDFADEALLLGLCAEEVPCGDFAREMFANAGITPSIDTNEPDVRALLGKVESGELDAGIVYVSDLVAAGDGVVGVPIPDDQNVVANYPIATLTEAADGDIAQAFVDYVLSDAGQEILQSHGFSAP